MNCHPRKTYLMNRRIESDPHQAEVEYCDHQVTSFASDRCGIAGRSHKVEEFVHNSNPHTCSNIIRDFNIHDKTVGYLALESIDFKFIGPDRPPVNITSINTCLQVANVILFTIKPNYREARIPVFSGLNVKMWENAYRIIPMTD